ncbi:hypothetical protein D3C80_388250 [compost metagenome]|jgi:hypothetical protein
MPRRALKILTVLAACFMVSGCYSCSLNGGWEGQMNPFCVEAGSLVEPIALPDSVGSASSDESLIRGRRGAA